MPLLPRMSTIMNEFPHIRTATITKLDVVIKTPATTLATVTLKMLCNYEKDNDTNAYLHGAALGHPALVTVQQHVHPVPGQRLHSLLAELHPKRR